MVFIMSILVAASTLLIAPSLTHAQSLVKRTPVCRPQAVSIAGTWQCFRTPSSGSSSNQIYTFTQNGNRIVSGEEGSYQIFGSVEGTAIKLSEVVNGEELEGFVSHADGHIISLNGGSNNGIVTVYRNSQEGTGSFNCFKQ
jgi:hypothetical protein